MSGHSKWATIRRKKEKTDAARGKVFTRLIKEISVAARAGGGDETGNPRLRTAVMAAKAANMPAANIDRAIKKGTGELPGIVYEEVAYEGYGPGGVALLITTLTDNRNRTVSEVRHLLGKGGGSLGETGSVNWMFERKSLTTISVERTTEDDLLELLLDHGVDDIRQEGDLFEVVCDPENMDIVKNALDSVGIEIASAEVTMIPQSNIKVEDPKTADSVLRLMEDLDDHDDVQQVYSNFDIDDEIINSAG
ncbi:YebC/PmpR family DNA-binding transcriptional regulator [candidate division LCP-89 bacterium B3_LCP]|uniref:Probable transcriptional regulatory protein CEE37_02185 n=1 Tax=candidate division LCP-89 bacterium B3_LCP TaxID=2012998 RepID=A0A532V6D1_UNCL8|nr:MAG: YebC/PmpR family DNA-binding transcriptional regulator [candidate division LCP-89 bacterium B3_LCP]